MNYELQLIYVPVSDVDRAIAFYTEKAGFNLDHDHKVSDDMRFVQLTPPGSACSISIGTGISSVTPGTAKGLHLVVSDIEVARGELIDRGIDVSEPFHFGPAGQEPGVDPQRADYGSFAAFDDPDGNGWLLQEVRQGSPGEGNRN
jgi:catechol 2,3-dioxygenase-like lactoylglutathione lyase family enzyme